MILSVKKYYEIVGKNNDSKPKVLSQQPSSPYKVFHVKPRKAHFIKIYKPSKQTINKRWSYISKLGL